MLLLCSIVGIISAASVSDVAKAWKRAGGYAAGCKHAVLLGNLHGDAPPQSSHPAPDGHALRGVFLLSSKTAGHAQVSDECAFDLECAARAAVRISRGKDFSSWDVSFAKEDLDAADAFCRSAAFPYSDPDCCLDGDCCHGLEYCCTECDGKCRCSVSGKCH
eukprot:ANDGO_07377.mRNA.1 hypothetical protein